jgi:HK97 family phage major capsid protein
MDQAQRLRDYTAQLRQQSATPGLGFARLAIAKALGKARGTAALDVARSRWGADSEPARIIKADVTGGSLGQSWGSLGDAQHVMIEFVEAAQSLEVISRLPGLRRVSAGVPGVSVTNSAVAYWVGEAKAIPMSRQVLNRDVLQAKKLAVLIAFTNEILEAGTPQSEQIILNDMLKAVVKQADLAFVSDDAATATTPAGIAHGVDSPQSVESTGDLADDVAQALEGFAGDLASAAWIMAPLLAAAINLLADGRGAGSTVHALGGSLVGLPVVTSEACETDTIILLDGSSVLLLDEGASIDLSRSGTVEMTDNPSGHGLSPLDSMDTNIVSLFQNSMTALLITRRMNWRVARQGAVSVITGADYGAVSS